MRAVLWVVAAVGIGLALLVAGLSEAVAGVFAVIGIGAAIGALAMGSRWRGRVGPAQPRQLSCCGCSCAVALLVLPTAGTLLWMQGGPGLAALALPAWVPMSWAIHGCGVLAARLDPRVKLQQSHPERLRDPDR
jgi:hypothetical protein